MNYKDIGDFIGNQGLAITMSAILLLLFWHFANEALAQFKKQKDLETEKATKLAVKVDKNINTYLIDFTEVGPGLPGQKFEGNLVITNVTMPEDKASVIREEGL